MTRERRSDLASLALILLVPVVIFADVLFFGAGLYDRDLSTYHWPMRTLVRNALLSGEFPHWNPFHLGGQPMAANPAYELFYPPQLLILLPDYLFGFQALLLFHLAVAMGGMFLFLRSLGIVRPAAAFGAITFGLSGPFLSTVNLNPAFFSLSWFPLVLLHFRQFFLRRRLRDAAFCTLFLALILLICEPVSVLQIGLLMLGYVVHRSFTTRSRSTLGRGVIVLGAVCLLAAAIAAAQLVPAVDLARDSVRGDGLVIEEALAWSTPPLRLLEIFFANVFGPLVENGGFYWGADRYGVAQGPFIRSFYPGVLVGLLGISALIFRARGTATYLLAIPLVLLTAFGDHTAWGGALYRAGLFRSIRYPEKWMLLAIFPLFIFAARGFELLLQGDERFIRFARTVALTILSFAATAALLARLPQYPEFFSSFWKISSTAVLPHMIAISRYEWVLAVAFAFGGTLLVVLRRKFSDTLWIGCSFLLVAIDLRTIVDALMPRMPRSYFMPAPIAQAARQLRRDPRLFHADAFIVGNPDAGKYGALGGNRYWVVRNAMAGMLPLASGIRTSVALDVDATSLVPTARFADLRFQLSQSNLPQWRERIADVSRTNLRTEWRPFLPEMGRIAGDFPSIQPMTLVADRDRAPVYFATKVIPMARAQDFRSTFLTGAIQHDVVAVQGPALDVRGGVVVSVSERWDEIDIKVKDASNSLLVIATTPHRYWSATIDGKPTPIVSANTISIGILIPRDAQTVKLRYRNPLIKVSATISIIVLLMAPLILAALRRILPSASTTDDSSDVPQHPEGIANEVDPRVIRVEPEHRNF